MLVVDEYFKKGVVVYLWAKYLWQQILERRQRKVLNTYKKAPVELRTLINDEEYEAKRNAALYRSGFEIFKGSLDVGLTTTFILFEGFRKLWDKSSEIVAYFDIKDTQDILKNALFLTLMSSGTFLVGLPFALLEIYMRQNEETSNDRITLSSVILSHSIAQTLLFPFVCLFILGFKLGGDKTLLWAFGFAEFQLITDLLNIETTESLPIGDLRKKLEELAKLYKFPVQDILVAKRLSGNKKVLLRGFPQPRNIVIADFLTHGDSINENESINDDDINALVAREMSHWSHGHPYIHFAVNQTHLCLHLYTMHRLLNSTELYRAFCFGNKPLAVGLSLLQYCPLFDLYNFGARMVNRRLEFSADEDVKRIQGDLYLKKAIMKIDKHSRSSPVQDNMYSLCYNSEATPYERITALNEVDL